VEERGDFTEKVRQFDGSKMLSPKAGVYRNIDRRLKGYKC
jgi:hypothetical protein